MEARQWWSYKVGASDTRMQLLQVDLRRKEYHAIAKKNQNIKCFT
jgi:hypothetical protein